MTDTPDTAGKAGRPTVFTETMTDEILVLLCEGKSLREICEAEHLPNRSTVFRRLHNDPAFQQAYAAARATGAEAMCDEVIELGRNATSENAAGVRVRVDTVKWAAARLAPKRWGDRVAAELSGPGGRPLQIQPVTALTHPQVAEALTDLIARAERDMSLPPGTGTDEERIQSILDSGEPVPPEIYEIQYRRGENG